MRHGADVVLVPVRQHQRGDLVLLQLAEVGDDEVDAEQLGLREHDAGIDEDGGVAAGDHHHVHAELAQASERHELERRVSSVRRQKTPVAFTSGGMASAADAMARTRQRGTTTGEQRTREGATAGLRGWAPRVSYPTWPSAGTVVRDRENSCKL